MYEVESTLRHLVIPVSSFNRHSCLDIRHFLWPWHLRHSGQTPSNTSTAGPVI